MAKLFPSSWQRIARAKTHIRDLDRCVQTFINRKPYKLFIQPQKDGIHEIHKLKAMRRNLPSSFSNIATDAIENLRAALDHPIYTIGAKIHTDPKILRLISFPFSTDSSTFPSSIGNCCKSFPEEIVSLLTSFKPFNGGNNTLWAINELAKTSKHKALTTVAFNILSMKVREISGFVDLALPPFWDRLNNEFVIGTRRQDTHATYKAGFQFDVGLGDVPAISSIPCVGLLNEMAGIVEGIVSGVEAECRRIKFFG
jgi:hypothetical protein